MYASSYGFFFRQAILYQMSSLLIGQSYRIVKTKLVHVSSKRRHYTLNKIFHTPMLAFTMDGRRRRILGSMQNEKIFRLCSDYTVRFVKLPTVHIYLISIQKNLENLNRKKNILFTGKYLHGKRKQVNCYTTRREENPNKRVGYFIL